MKIKTRFIKAGVVLSGLLFALGTTSWSQTALSDIAQGRAYLAASNIVSAELSFSNAVALAPTDPNANFFYGVTRVLSLPLLPAGSNFLTRWGFSTTGRNIYHWASKVPTDSNGNLIVPTGVDADEFTALLRTNFLTAIIGAEANLGAITNTNYLVTLTSQEIGGGVTIDYGDIQAMRTIMQVMEYFIYTTYSWNLDAQLTTIRSLYTNDQFSTGGLLQTYPNLFTYATTNDLINAKATFISLVSRYVTASQIIRNRPPGETRLFNFDTDNAKDVKMESQVRQALIDLTNSLQGPVVLADNAGSLVYAGAQFTGTHPLRSFAPKFVNSGFVLGTEPDITFGGTVLSGITTNEFEKMLGKRFTPIPNIVAPSFGEEFAFLVYGMAGHGYVIQGSDDLADWTDLQSFVSLGGPVQQMVNPGEPNSGGQFYRVVDRGMNIAPPPNDDFENSLPISGVGISVPGYNLNGSEEADEPGFYAATAWWSWTAQTNGVVIAGIVGDTDGSENVSVYVGDSVDDLSQVDELFDPILQFNGYAFQAEAGQTYQIQVGSFFNFDGTTGGGYNLVVTSVPVVDDFSPTNAFLVVAPGSSVPLSLSASDFPATISQVTFTLNGKTIASTNGAALSFNCTNFEVGYNNVQAILTDSVGFQSTISGTVLLPPPNDNFANRTPLTGLPVSAAGTNEGATIEDNEPTNQTVDASIWWSWTAPATGQVTISAALNGNGNDLSFTVLGVYTGNNLSTLTPVAAANSDGGPASVNINAHAGTAYQIQIASADFGFGDEEGPVFLHIEPSQPPTIALTSPNNGAAFGVNSNVTIHATATDSLVNIASVEFYFVESNIYYFLGSSSASPYTFVWNPTTAGSYGIAAQAIDNAGFSSGYSPLVSISVTNTLGPANDNFANRTIISGGSITIDGSNVGATKEPGEPVVAGNAGGASVWYQWTAPKTGSVTINTTGSSFDTILGVCTGTAVSSLIVIVSNDNNSNFGGGLTSQVVFTANAGTIYDIVVDGHNAATGSIVLNLSQP